MAGITSIATCQHANMAARNGYRRSTFIADNGDKRPLQSDALAPLGPRGGELPARPVHAVGARGDGAPLASGEAHRPGVAVPRDKPADGRLHDDRDASGALAAPRRGRLQAGARPASPSGAVDRLTIAI